MTPKQIAEYLRRNASAVPILQAALRHEDAQTGQPTYLGWSWHDVRAYPATLMKLVVDGLLTVNYKSNSSTYYLLTDRAAVKQVLAGYRAS